MRPIRSKTALLLATGLVVLALLCSILGWNPFGSKSPVQRVTIRLWAYSQPPANALLAWISGQLRELERRLNGRSRIDTSLVLGGSELLWSYSTKTSGWFQFGNMVRGTNLCYWSFALPQGTNLSTALPEIPNLHFLGPDSNAWALLLPQKDMGFASNVVGRGGIRLLPGRVIAVRNVRDSDNTYLVQCQEIGKGWRGEMKVRFLFRAVPSSEAAPP